MESNLEVVGGAETYEPPAVTVHGSVVELTQASYALPNADMPITAGQSILGRTSA